MLPAIHSRGSGACCRGRRLHAEDTSSLGLLRPVVKTVEAGKGRERQILFWTGPTAKVSKKVQVRPSSFLQVSRRLSSIGPLINPRQGSSPNCRPLSSGWFRRVQAPQGPRDPCCLHLLLALLPDHTARGATCTGHAGRDRWNPALLPHCFSLPICMTEWQIHEIHSRSSAFPFNPMPASCPD